jgi:tetratricopeptide (TPR) repeat protein/glycosyltransferase involved in cell wall biosynthesis
MGGAQYVFETDVRQKVLERSTPTPTGVIREGLCDGKHWEMLQQEGTFFSTGLWFRAKHGLKGFELAGDWNFWREMAHHGVYYQYESPLGAFRRRVDQLSVERIGDYRAEIERVVPLEVRKDRFEELELEQEWDAKVIKFDGESGRMVVEVESVREVDEKLFVDSNLTSEQAGADGCLEEARNLQQKGRFEEAVTAYKTNGQNQNFAEAHYDFHYNLGQSLGQLHRWEEAVVEYRKAISFGFAKAELRHHLGHALIQLGRWDEAGVELQEWDANVISSDGGSDRMGVELQSVREVYEKVKDVEESRETKGDPWLVPHRQAATLRKQGKLDEAIAAYQEAIEINPGYASSYCELGEVLQQQGKLDEAIAAYQEATELGPEVSLFHRSLAGALATNNQFDEAVASYRTSVKLDSNSAEVYKELGSTLVKRTEFDLDEAVRYYSQAIYLNPQDVESFNCLQNLGKKDHNLYVDLANYLIQENYLEPAIKVCEIATELQVSNYKISQLYNLALGKKAKLEQNQALKIYYEKLEKFPNDPEVYLKLGKALREQSQLDKAIVFYEIGLQVQPDYAEIYFELGNALKDRDNRREAVEYYKKAIEIRPDSCWYYNSLGDAWKSMGNFEQAVNNYRRALEINPDFAGFSHNLEKALKNQERVNSIRNFCQVFSKQQKSKIDGNQSLKILMVTSYPPYPPNSGGPMRMFEEIKYLGSRHHLVVVSFIFSEEDYNIEIELADYCDRVIMVMLGAPYAQRKPNDPKQVHRWHTWNMRKTLEELQGINFDVVLFDFIYMASYVDLFEGAYKILEEHNIESNLLKQCAEASQKNSQLEKVAADVDAVKAFLGAEKETRLLQEYEKRTWSKFDLVTLVSEVDRKQVEQSCPGAKTLVVENGADTDGITPVDNSQGRKILFMGNLGYYPNIDGVLFFVEEVLPKIWEQDASIVFCIAGRDPGVQIQKLAQDYRIEVVASPKDMSEVAKDCMITVVPLRLGSGTRLKVLHSMAMGLPVISTSLGCEGLLVEDGFNIRIADEPQELANAVIEVSKNIDLRSNLRFNGIELVQSQYDWKRIFSGLEQNLFDKIVV